MSDTTSTYPLTQRSLLFGGASGAVVWLMTGNVLPAYAIFVLCVMVGGTWRRDDAPIFPFILAFQWLQVTCGYVFFQITENVPSSFPMGDIDQTVQIALTGLLLMAVAIRLSGEILRQGQSIEEPVYVWNLRGLFWLVIALYAVNYVYVVNTKAFGSLDVILERVLEVRQVPLLLLWFDVIRQQRHRLYLWVSLIWVFVPKLGSYFSDFKTPLLLLLVVSAAAWKPWESGWWRFRAGGIVRTIAVAVAVVFLTLTWQAGVKEEARKVYDAAAIGSSPIDRVELFVTNAVTAVPVVFSDTQTVVEDLITRFWYVGFFSRVLEYVPAIEPHADGELLRMAVQNAFMPRFLFPNKPVQGSDSYLTRRFTGMLVSEESSSISIGYMAEFYADWGLRGMYLSVFGYGLLMGAAAWAVQRFIRPRILINPTLITVLMVVSFFEHQFIKTFAALNLAVIITVGVIWLVRNRFTAFLDLRAIQEDTSDAAAWTPTALGRRAPRAFARKLAR